MDHERRILLWGPDQTWRVRALERKDVPVMARWLSDPRVLAHYGGRDRPMDEDKVAAKYLARQGEPIQACLVEKADGAPLGYVQIVRLSPQEAAAYGHEAEGSCGDAPRVYALDMFLGDPLTWGQGLGTALASALLAHLASLGADAVQVDPRVGSARAIRCYEKAGFRIVQRLPHHELHEGMWCDNWLMAAWCSP